MPRDVSYRQLLPDDVVPYEYDLELEPDLTRFTFDGEVAISVTVNRATSSVTLHASQLTVSKASFVSADGASQAVTGLNFDIADGTVQLRFAEELQVGKGTLKLTFQGTLNDQMCGFYRSKYKSLSGEDRFMATTQFEPCDARKSFPCWDEPARKAVFRVTMIVPPGLTAFSNMPEEKYTTLRNGGRRVTFQPTPIMSTYLVAYIVGEFDYIQDTTKDGLLVRLISVPGKTAKAQFSLKTAIRCLEIYNEFFGIKYPLAKMDMVAIPDFAQGAMENWGLVTYREIDLLCDEATASCASKQRVCNTVAHELAHQWFGNLVTMTWWDDLWLNEGFATWLANWISDKLHPEWGVWEDFVCSDQMRALQLDALRSSHPIQQPVSRAEQVDEIFDIIAYSKGGSVLRMAYAVLGEDHFRSGLADYLQQFKYSNSETADLWAAWDKSSGSDTIGKMMNTWTDQMGCPVLSVTDAGSGKVKVEQSYFVADGTTKDGDAAKQWIVPIFIGGKDGRFGTELQMLETKSAEFAVPQGWFKVNFGQHVTCRVLYSPEVFAGLCGSVHDLPPEDRIGLLNDSVALTRGLKMCPRQLFELLKGFTEKDGVSETNDKVWTELAITLKKLHESLCNARDASGSPECVKVLTAFERLAAKLVGPAAERVGWDERPTDDDNTKSLRASLLDLVGLFNGSDPKVQAEARRRYDAFRADAKTRLLPEDIRAAVFRIACKTDGVKVFEELKKMHNESTDSALRIHVYQGVAEGPPEVKQMVLNWALTDDVRGQDVIYPMAYTARSTSFGGGAQMVFDWTKAEIEAIRTRLSGNASLIQSVVKVSGAGFSTKEKAEDVRKFWEAQKIAGMTLVLEQTIEGICVKDLFVKYLIEACTKGKFEGFEV
eukprot:TRINITY_DN47000_c0_g1_i1.p1 TRINITY_DN47000_c0_g1~~TRINITY_DN47000_c0_g1_i1.p1  ORF type:complete len:884 (+),score=298.07 TRINITY_DN47000_c0_g1_i1:58-2709(+)